MSKKIKNSSTNKSQAKEKPDGLQVRGNVNLSLGVQILGMKSNIKKEQLLKFFLITLVIVLILTIIATINDSDLTNRLTNIIEKLLTILQVAFTSKDVWTGLFKKTAQE